LLKSGDYQVLKAINNITDSLVSQGKIMNKNLTWKIVFILVIAVVAGYTLYPPEKTLKPGIDLAGGTSLIYEINTQGLKPAEKKGLSEKMITILRRRIDPANIQNLIWRPQGNTRFEIQLPLASPQARQKRQEYENAIDSLLSENINIASIMRSLKKSDDDRKIDFEKYAQGSTERLAILEELAKTYDEKQIQEKLRDKVKKEIKTAEGMMPIAGLDIEKIKPNLNKWSKLSDEKLAEELKTFLGANTNISMLTQYVQTYVKWAETVEKLIEPETGAKDKYKVAQRNLDQLNLSADEINAILENDRLTKRQADLDTLKVRFPQKADKVDALTVAFDEYEPFKGRLDDPKDIQRMLKGAGILEFRILPIPDHPEVDADAMENYRNRLQTKGPKYASDNNYIWSEIENPEEFKVDSAVIGQFGEKWYVLASNKKNETMLHKPDEKPWKLKSALPRPDQMGRRAIGFTLDERGGKLFGNVTGKNLERPLCILLDGMALSAPNIQSRISTQGIITGTFSQDEIDDMTNKLNAGSLPARLNEQPISVKTIGPSIGADNRDKGVKAGIIGLVTVIVCMTAYYTLAGSIAVVALLMNLLLVLAIMALVRATFTLPGIAGIILTIGMSVDANVLIFERIREEQQKGSSLRVAIANGYQKAFRTILDANITTFITAAILFWVASEEIKGFAIVLMLGIASSMFTALFVTRVVFDWLLSKKLIKDHLVMLRIVKKPNINWMKLRPIFLTISLILIVCGLFIFFTRDNVTNNKYDIEFTGGTMAQISLKDDVNMTRQDVEDSVRKVGEEMGSSALASANVYSIGESNKEYAINTTATNKTAVTVTLAGDATMTAQQIEDAVGDDLRNFTVIENSNTFEITTSNTNKGTIKSVLEKVCKNAQISEPVVDTIVNTALMAAFEGKLKIKQNLNPTIASTDKITEDMIESYPELADFIGGVKITCELGKDVSGEELLQRFSAVKSKIDLRDLKWYNYKVMNADLSEVELQQNVKSFVYVSADPEAGFRQFDDSEWENFTDNETRKVNAVGQLESSLAQITQFSPTIGTEAKTKALIAIVLSLFAIVTYVWIRFGDVRYGVAAIVALLHDVCITLGVVVACTYIASTAIGEKLLIADFKIDLAMIAAFLTLIGYSLNDTIVIFDRIRENKHKARLNPKTIADSINQTIPRTVLTSLTTFIVVLIMYIFGGTGLRGFTFAIGLGIIVGTYSSIAIAAPILLIGVKKTKESE